MRWNLTLQLFLISFSCFSQEPYLFIGTYTSGKSKGIYVYKFNIKTGAATGVSSIEAKNPSYLCLSADGRFLYATDEEQQGGAIGAYAFEATTGHLALLNAQSSQGSCPCYVSEDKAGKWVFVANYCSGSLAALPVNSDGSLAPAMQVIQQFGKGADTARQKEAHVHSTIFSPDERFLLEANLGTDQEHVYIYHPDEMIPLKEPLDSVTTLQPGSGPRHIAFHPKKSDVYILSELSGTIDGSADIHIRPDGKFLYATNRGTSNTIAVFEIRKDGMLATKQIISVNGKHPRNFVIDPGGHFLLIANRDTDNIVIFSIDPASGLLKATGKEINIPNPVCLKFLSN
jgi:6-phosphogluconolactonase